MTALPADLDAALVAVSAQRPLLVASDYDGVLARLRDERRVELGRQAGHPWAPGWPREGSAATASPA